MNRRDSQDNSFTPWADEESGLAPQHASLERLKQFEDIINTGPSVTMIWRIAAPPKLEFVSDSVRQFGYDPAEFLSGEITLPDIVHPDDRQRVIDVITCSPYEQGYQRELEYRIVTKSGEERWVTAYVRLRQSVSAAQMYCRMVLVDSTGRKAAESQLAQYESKRLELADAVNKALIEEIAERKRAEESLKDSEQQLRTLINAMPDIICFKDGEGRWLEANDYDLELFELKGVDYRGKTDCDLAPYSEFYRESFNTCGETDEAAWRAGRMVRADEVIPVPNGPPRVFDIIKVPTFYPDGRRKGLVVIGRDVTQKALAEQALKASERRLSDIINFLPDATIVIDSHGVIIAWNKATELLTGCKAEDMIGNGDYAYAIPIYGVRRPLLIDMVLSPSEALKNYENVTIEGNAISAEAYTPELGTNGAYIWGKASALYDEQGNVVGAIESFRDITDRVKAEEAARAVEAHKRAFYKKTIMAATEGKLIISDASEIESLAGPAIKSWDVDEGRNLSVIRNDAERIALEVGMDERRVYDFILCIGEATTNAYKHAQGGKASIHRLGTSLLFVVSDHGRGIEAVMLPDVALVKGYSTAGTLGMGYKAILSLADRVYLATSSTGTTVAIEMDLVAPAPRQIAIDIPDTWQ